MARVLRQLQNIRGRPLLWTAASTRHQCRVLSAKSSDVSLVQIKGGHKFNPVWLRQNCRCPTCFNQPTEQNNILPHHVANVQAQNVTSSGNDVSVTWSDGHKSKYSLSWLLRNSFPGAPDKTRKFLWNGDVMHEAMDSGEFPRINGAKLLKDENSLKALLASLLTYGIGIVEDVPATLEDTQKCVERVSFIEKTMFGEMWSFTADMARSDTAYTNIDVGAHTDSTYLTVPTGIQVFHCLQHDGKGGDTLLVDGFQVAESVRKSNPEGFKLLASTRIHHQYLEAGYDVKSLDSVLKVHPVSQAMECIRFNHYDRSPITTIPQGELQSFYDALWSLSSAVENPDNEYWLKLKPGTVLFVDNWRVMHGRSSFTGNRRVCGSYLPRTFWQSQARVMGLL